MPTTYSNFTEKIFHYIMCLLHIFLSNIMRACSWCLRCTLMHRLLNRLMKIILKGNHCILWIQSMTVKVHILWEGHKILRNFHRIFDWHYIGSDINQRELLIHTNMPRIWSNVTHRQRVCIKVSFINFNKENLGENFVKKIGFLPEKSGWIIQLLVHIQR